MINPQIMNASFSATEIASITNHAASSSFGTNIPPITSSGLLVGALIPLITTLLNHLLSRNKSAEDRKEDFKLKLYEFKIKAAQIAHQHLFKIYRARSTLVSVSGGTGGIRTSSGLVEAQLVRRLEKEAREWLDGERFILGEEIYGEMIKFINGPVPGENPVGDINAVQKVLNQVLKLETV